MSDDQQAFGSDVIDMVRRQASIAVNPTVQQLWNENRHLWSRMQAAEARSIYEALDAAVPGWRTQNTSSEFLDALQTIEPLSGRKFAELLREGFAQGNIPRTVQIFRQFANSQGGSAAGSQRSARSTASKSFASEAPVTSQDIDNFYRAVAQGRWAGRDKERVAEEVRLHRAAHLNGVRRGQ